VIIEIGGGEGGLKAYLEEGRKQGREFHRDELDQRIPLAGDLAAFELACDAFDSTGDRYDHFTLSFSEDFVSDEMLQRAVVEFRDHVFAAWAEPERSRVAFYAEAHRPKIKTYLHAETGELIERKTHIHIGIGRRDLLTGKHVQLVGYLGPGSNNLRYLDAWQESFNARHGFASPKTNPRVSAETAIDMLARYTGQRPDELGSFNQRKAALEVQIQKAIIDQGVISWEGLGQLLRRFGAVSKLRSGQFNESFALTPPGASRRIRLQGVFFQREFVERPTAEKLQILMESARRVYIEQKAPLLDAGHLRETLAEWHAVKSREIRFLHSGSRFYKEVYLAADAAGRANILDSLQRERHPNGIASPANDRDRQAATARDRLPKLPVRHMDGIQARSKMLLRRDDGVDVRAGSAGAPTGHRLRQADGSRAERGRARGPLKQPSRVVTQLREELLEKYEAARADRKYVEIRHNLDCEQLLARLSHSHGLEASLYATERAADGSARIRCGSRLLTPNDFLQQEMGLQWREAAPILREVYEQQIGKRIVRPRARSDGVEARTLWRQFQNSRADHSSPTERLAQFDAQTKAGRAALAARARRERAVAMTGIGREGRQAVSAAERLRAVAARAEYAEARREERQLIRPPQREAWRAFLQERAQAGDGAALRLLRRIDDSARETDGLTISGVSGLPAIEEERKRRMLSASAVLRTLQAHVERNGDVTYTRAGRAVLRDQGERLQIMDPHSDEVILAGLLLAQDLYGSMLTLTGPEDFQRRVVALAVEHGLPVKFEDPALEALRVQRHADKVQAKTGSAPAARSAAHQMHPPAPWQEFVAQPEPAVAIPASTPSFVPEASPVLDVDLQADQKAEARAELKAALGEQGREVREIVEQVLYAGGVREVTPSGLLVQSVSRNAVVIHDLARLEGRFEVGQEVEIRYNEGRGSDSLQGKPHDQGVNR
jgi:hypothetical protein